MRISVIVISKDDISGLKKTLQSIECQRIHPNEVIIVTKGASNNIRLEDFKIQAYLRHVVQKDNGISSAFNLALTFAKEEWVNFLNGGDVYADSEVLARLNSKSFEDIDIIAGRAFDNSSKNIIPRDLYFKKNRLDQISHQASFFRREMFERFGGYSQNFRIRMDFEWMLRLDDMVRVIWLDELLINFEGGGASSIYPMLSCLEEYSALCRHNHSFLRRARLMLLFLPYRIVRNLIRYYQ
jgi:glycosyltransferase involved in cell wall biosynthesis